MASEFSKRSQAEETLQHTHLARGKIITMKSTHAILPNQRQVYVSGPTLLHSLVQHFSHRPAERAAHYVHINHQVLQFRQCVAYV